ncbi:MAG: hypothetical protein QM647_15025 [Asticcacaulis sp.]|uniref:hypothetical protein n=1 Tax=Asticcacaulis sp. TaxID=1872648 RepID=UPI0039E36B11
MAGINSVVMAVPVIQGAPGRSAYQLWLDAGNEGTEADYIASLKGDKGDKGDTGAAGLSLATAVGLSIALGG